MKNNDFDFIKDKMENEGVSAPEELSEESIRARLEKGTSADNIIKFKPNNKRFFKGAVSIAAAIALVVVSLSVANHYNNKITDNNGHMTGDGSLSYNDEIVYFTSYDEIDKLMKDRLSDSDKFYYGSKYSRNFAKSGDEIVEESAADGALSNSSSAPSHSETYKQVDAVDEADIVKTDGKYIYVIRDNEQSEVIIFSADNGKTEKVSTIKLKENSWGKEMFISGDTLVVISTLDGYNKKGNFSSSTLVCTYDISNKEKPNKEYEYTQSGYYTSSRMLGGCVYIVSDHSSFYYYKDYAVPCTATNGGDYEKLAPADICAVKDSESAGYTVIGAVDITNGKNASSKTKAIIGCAQDIYCNENNLYVAGVNYEHQSYGYSGYYLPQTTIVKYSFDKTEIKLAATGKVEGNINNQFSMDEKDGYFRIATTTQSKSGKDINVLYVLDEKLSKVGKVDGFAKNEHIEAVRFIGDMAYVITYERTDPLFIIDLSNPKAPQILGEVKISGFSTLLVPIDEKTLLGIGYATEESEFGEATSGLKLALFDISNPASPRVLDAKELNDTDSPVQDNHKALVVNSEKNYFAIPAWYDDYANSGALVFNAKNGKINILEKFASKKIAEPDRCVYIGNYIYVVDTYEGIIDSFEV
ncbi:MAG: beta-propeller domain-containing protein [Eubacterium sp.]|nr:beta-propeller domain-containing protein [Eubacterium sp.]